MIEEQSALISYIPTGVREPGAHACVCVSGMNHHRWPPLSRTSGLAGLCLSRRSFLAAKFIFFFFNICTSIYVFTRMRLFTFEYYMFYWRDNLGYSCSYITPGSRLYFLFCFVADSLGSPFRKWYVGVIARCLSLNVLLRTLSHFSLARQKIKLKKKKHRKTTFLCRIRSYSYR